MHKYVQNSSSNGGLDTALEAALDGKLNVRFEWRLRVLFESN